MSGLPEDVFSVGEAPTSKKSELSDVMDLVAGFTAGGSKAKGTLTIHGTHARVATLLSNLVNMGYCVLGNHKWIRKPEGALQMSRTASGIHATGAITHTCAICEAALVLDGKSVVDLDSLIPIRKAKQMYAELKALPKTMADALAELKGSPQFKDYKANAPDIFNANNAGIEKMAPLILKKMEGFKLSSSDIQSVEQAFNAFKEL